jgi:branched-chain amino acid aminotransferase
MRLVNFNGQLIPESRAKISIYDSALMFGDMVFEMTRSFNGKQFKLREHLERLYSGIKILRIPVGIDIDEMERRCHETQEANQFAPDDEHRLMIDVSRGTLGIYQDVVGLHKGPNIIISDFPLRWTVAGMGHLFDSGINAVIPSQRAIPASLLDPKIKNRSRIHYQMANIEVSQTMGEDNWALLLDPDGNIAEGTGDNFFIIKDGSLITPEPRNILRGISRDYVMRLAGLQELGLEVVERNISPYDVYTADEAFMTGTPFCMLPVCTLNGIPIGCGTPGTYYQSILGYWSTFAGVDIKAQIKAWDSGKAGNGPTPYQFA